MKRKNWVIAGLLVGLALLVAGFFTPGYFCMDACSSTPPNFQMLIVGAVLLVIALALRTTPKPNKSTAARKATVSTAITAGAIMLIATTLNGWALFFVMMPLILIFGSMGANSAGMFPFILVGIPVGLGGILWLIIFAVIRSGEKLKDQPAPSQPLS